ncbi:MAG TPA: hypothetical protein VNH63_06995 [Gemmatimonadales bacterium]|nr:hypothetical protein [Gemmatimonadales bacterium]
MSAALSLHCRALPGLPPLAWVAVVPAAGGTVAVYHGAAVECRDEWLVAGTWDDEFREGNFHASDHFFGTGLRVCGETLYAAPASALLNRVVSCTHRGRTIVSNSLALLLGFTGARLDPAHDYRRETYAIRAGEGRYDKAFRVLHPEIAAFHQVSGETLVLRDGTTSFASLRATPVIPSFERYRELVTATLDRLRRNYASRERRFPMSAYIAMSAGYDSAASAVLVKDLGLEACFTARRSNSHVPRWLSRRAAVDDATPIARRLGIRTMYLDAGAAGAGEDEAYFLAPGCAPAMVVLHSLTRHIEASGRPAVVFTGFLGDEVWDMDPKERGYGSRGIVRGDTTALMLSEIELKSGFTCVAVPALLARGIADITTLNGSTEMAPWRVGGTYDRPIPRRVLAEAGVPAHLFAQRKKAVVNTRMFPANPHLRREFFAALRQEVGWGPARVHLHALANQAAFWCFRGYHTARRLLFAAAPPKTPAVLIGAPMDLAYRMFGWACHRVSRQLAAALEAP